MVVAREGEGSHEGAQSHSVQAISDTRGGSSMLQLLCYRAPDFWRRLRVARGSVVERGLESGNSQASMSCDM